jgi:hypothetical protein
MEESRGDSSAARSSSGEPIASLRVGVSASVFLRIPEYPKRQSARHEAGTRAERHLRGS